MIHFMIQRARRRMRKCRQQQQQQKQLQQQQQQTNLSLCLRSTLSLSPSPSRSQRITATQLLVLCLAPRPASADYTVVLFAGMFWSIVPSFYTLLLCSLFVLIAPPLIHTGSLTSHPHHTNPVPTNLIQSHKTQKPNPYPYHYRIIS